MQNYELIVYYTNIIIRNQSINW